MRLIKWILILIGCIFILSCDDIMNPGDIVISITPSVEDFIWENEILISAIATKVDDLDKIVFFIDGEEVFEDNIEPFEYIWNTATLSYADHTIEAVGYYDNKTSRDEITVFFSPCPIYEEDLQDFEDITETNIQGDLVNGGNIDDDDWNFGEGIVGTTFGPGFPNPANLYCNIPFTLEEEQYITIIIINDDHDIIDVLCNKELYQAGDDHFKTFQPPANVSDIYRVIFHISQDQHWHGDVLVE